MPHRQNEIEILSFNLVEALKGHIPSNMTLYGVTGAGKTAVTSYVCDQLEDKGRQLSRPVQTIIVNCRQIDTQYRVLSHIGNSLLENHEVAEIPFTGWPTDRVFSELVRRMDSRKGVFMSPTKSFVLPEDKDTDIIMVGPGTGIAPFRAFMEQRVFDGGQGRNWLFFGDQSEKTEFYYKDTIESWLDNGDLYRFTTAWSRDQAEKIYVQHRLKEHGAEIWEWFENGAYFYICGDKTYMAKDVHRALIEIAIEHGGMSEEDATHFIEKTMMKEQKRYLRDVY